MSNIIDFLNNKKQIICHIDDKEFEMSFSDIVDAYPFFLEYCHNYIQWLFPLNESSAYNADAPILSESDINTIKDSKYLQSVMCEAFESMMKFYGFRYSPNNNDYTLIKNYRFDQYAINWLTKNNHNFLRITRILKCLKLVGLDDLAKSFYDVLSIVYNENKDIISKKTFDFWTKAAKGE